MDKLIPVVMIKDVNETEKMLSVLRAGDINFAEITFRTVYYRASSCKRQRLRQSSEIK